MEIVSLKFDEAPPLTSEDSYDLRELKLVELHHLLADHLSPCPIFIYKKNSWHRIINHHEVFPLTTLKDLREEGFRYGFIPIEFHGNWLNWVRQRTPQKTLESFYENEESLFKYPKETRDTIKKNRAFSVKQVLLSAAFRETKKKEEKLTLKSHASIREAIYHPFMDWFFAEPLPTERRQSGIRLLSVCSLFINSLDIRVPYWVFDCLFFNSLLYYLLPEEEGESPSVLVSEKLRLLRHPFPKSVIETLKQMDELYSGQGMPKRLKGNQITPPARILSLVKTYLRQYDQLPSASRRDRHENAKTWMIENELHFEPGIFKLFMSFIDRLEIFK